MVANSNPPMDYVLDILDSTYIKENMKREINFRAWDPLNKYFVTCNFNTRIKVVVSDLYEKGFVQQFTGLHDKNGKEIYEGDIVRLINANEGFDGLCACVRFEEGAFVIYKGNERLLLGSCRSEVIGNIYENNNLLK